VVDIVEHLNAQIREVVPRNVDATLIEIEKPDPSGVVDPDVARHRVAVDNHYRHLGDRRKDFEHVARNSIGKRAHVGIDTEPGVRQLCHPAATKSLRVADGDIVKLLERCGNEMPIVA